LPDRPKERSARKAYSLSLMAFPRRDVVKAGVLCALCRAAVFGAPGDVVESTPAAHGRAVLAPPAAAVSFPAAGAADMAELADAPLNRLDGLDFDGSRRRGAADSPPSADNLESVLGRAARVAVGLDRAAAEVSPRYLSTALDAAIVFGGPWWSADGASSRGRGTGAAKPVDLKDPVLRARARALAPGYLRVGGTGADTLYYDLSDHPVARPPKGFDAVLTKERWNELADFCRATGLELVFTLNAGPAVRDRRGRWKPDQAEALLAYARAHGDRVAVWELGNEPNVYAFTSRLTARISAQRYADDFAAARRLVQREDPGARLAGPGSAYWPVIGEPLSPVLGLTKGFLKRSREPVDIVSWHYYPTQSDRCPIATRRASAAGVDAVKTLDEVDRWADEVRRERDRFQPQADLWLGETGPAQCGGQRGLSNRYISGLWWLDQLGALARRGESVQIRQDLVGSDYGLLSEGGFAVNPDYWNSLAWKTLMGARVLAAQVAEGPRDLRIYAHCSAAGASARTGAVTLLAINVSKDAPAAVDLRPFDGKDAVLYRFDAVDPFGTRLRLNGRELTPPSVLSGEAMPGDGFLRLAPQTYGFVVFPDAAAPACSARAGS